MRRKKKSDQLRKIIYIFLVYKILIISIAYASYILIPENFTRRKNSDTPLLDPFAQLDARAYLDIAKNGYNAGFDIHKITQVKKLGSTREVGKPKIVELKQDPARSFPL